MNFKKEVSNVGKVMGHVRDADPRFLTPGNDVWSGVLRGSQE